MGRHKKKKPKEEESDEMQVDLRKMSKGRPRIDIPLDQLKALCERQCSDDEIAAKFACSTRTIEMRKRDPEFLKAMNMGKATGRIMLRSKLMEMALSGKYPILTIFACKTILGLKEGVHVDHQINGGQPIQVEHNHQVDISIVNEFLASITVSKTSATLPAKDRVIEATVEETDSGRGPFALVTDGAPEAEELIDKLSS